MSQRHKIVRILPAAELKELEGFADDRMRTVDECHAWLADRGHTIGRTAVANWLSKRRRDGGSFAWIDSMLRDRFDKASDEVKRRHADSRAAIEPIIAELRAEFFSVG